MKQYEVTLKLYVEVPEHELSDLTDERDREDVIITQFMDDMMRAAQAGDLDNKRFDVKEITANP